MLLLNFGVHESRWSLCVVATDTGASQRCDGKQRFWRRNAIVQHSRTKPSTKPSLLCPLVGPFGCFSPVWMLMLSCLMWRIWPLHKTVADQDWMRSCSETDQNSCQPQPTHTSGKGSILQSGINSQRQRLERRKKRMPTGRHNLGWKDQVFPDRFDMFIMFLQPKCELSEDFCTVFFPKWSRWWQAGRSSEVGSARESILLSQGFIEICDGQQLDYIYILDSIIPIIYIRII